MIFFGDNNSHRLVAAVCTCDDTFDYFSEIYDEAHYNYTGFPYLECVA